MVLVVAALVGGAVFSGFGQFELDEFRSGISDTYFSGLRVKYGKDGTPLTPARRPPSRPGTNHDVEPKEQQLAGPDDASAAHPPQVCPDERCIHRCVYIYIRAYKCACMCTHACFVCRACSCRCRQTKTQSRLPRPRCEHVLPSWSGKSQPRRPRLPLLPLGSVRRVPRPLWGV